jgi:trk system potassium uptake protein TrkA
VYVLIVGCGRLGSQIATNLSRSGSNVVVVDRNKEAFNLLSADFSGFQDVGDGTEQEVLRNAGVSDADVVAAVTDNDNANLMIAQVSKEIFGVKQVLARVGDPSKSKIYERLGVRVLSTTTVSAETFENEILRSRKVD